MIEMEEYITLAAIVFLSSFIGNIAAYRIMKWYQDRMYRRAFEPIFRRRANE